MSAVRRAVLPREVGCAAAGVSWVTLVGARQKHGPTERSAGKTPNAADEPGDELTLGYTNCITARDTGRREGPWRARP